MKSRQELQTKPIAITDARLKWWFHRLNRAYFDDRLPTPSAIRFVRLPHLAGVLQGNEGGKRWVIDLELAPALRYSLRLALIALLHEMVHIAYPHSGHGPRFKRAIRGLVRRGAYNALL